MRTKSAQVTAVLANPSHGARALVTVYSSSGVAGPTWGTDAPNGQVDPTLSVEIEQSIDAFFTARVSLQRQQGKYSLAPLVTSGNLLYGSEPPVAVGRRILIELELMPADYAPSLAGVKATLFDGFIDEVSWPNDTLELVCTDKWAKLRDTWIEAERVYAYAQGANATKGVLVWRSDLPALVLNELVVPSEKNANAHFYKVTAVSGAQGTTEPVWPTGTGATVVSGGVTFTEAGAVNETGTAIETVISQVLADNGLGSFVTLQTPVSPGWNIKPYIQQRESVADALQAMAEQLGWTLRFDWSSSLGRFELTLAEPARSSSTVHRTFTEDEEYDCESLSVDVWSIRNVVRIIYSASGTRDPAGNPLRLVREVSDSASITKYGRRFMEVAEADASNIDTSTEADRMANAILADLKEPTAGLAVSFACDPYLELGDRLSIAADGLRFTAAQTLAVERLVHRISEEGARTTAHLRGAPAAHRVQWLESDSMVREGYDYHQVSLLNATSTVVNQNPIVSGTRVRIQDTRTKGAHEQAHELHVSATSGFTPDSSTLKGAGSQSDFEVADLVPGKTYYVKTVPYTKNAARLVRGSPSVEQSFVAGRTRTGHFGTKASPAHLPLNGNFEDASDDITAAPPDHWTVAALGGESEAWGASESVYYGDDTAERGRYVVLRNHASKRGRIVSSVFEVKPSLRALFVHLTVMRTTGSNAAYNLICDIQGFSDAALTNQTMDLPVTLSGSASGPFPAENTWYEHSIDVVEQLGGDLPSDVNFVRIVLRRDTTGSTAFAWRISQVFAQECAVVGKWTNVTYQNGYADRGVDSHPVQYCKDANGFVHLRGAMTAPDNTLSVTAFTLPLGFRPAKVSIFIVFAVSNWAQFTIYPTGVCTIDNAGNVNWDSYIYLDIVKFDTRA